VSNFGKKPEGVVSAFLPFDKADSRNAMQFEEILIDMKRGGSENGTLTRLDKDGNNQNIFYSYSPVLYRELKPIRPDNFTRGAEASQVVLYSLIVAETENHLYEKFTDVSSDIQSDLSRSNAIFLVVTAIITLICIFVTARVSKPLDVW
jgi:hypothetical protein